MKIWSIGHSTRDIDTFIKMLKHHKIDMIADVRSMPGSNRSPWFNQAEFKETLSNNDIGYTHFEHLGGRRRKSKTVSPDINNWWEEQSFQNYADWTMEKEFPIALNELSELSEKYNVAMMCGETLYYHCHRWLISDNLIGICKKEVYHITNMKEPKRHRLTSSAQVGSHVTYPVK